jgi:hypothetical protein
LLSPRVEGHWAPVHQTSRVAESSSAARRLAGRHTAHPKKVIAGPKLLQWRPVGMQEKDASFSPASVTGPTTRSEAANNKSTVSDDHAPRSIACRTRGGRSYASQRFCQWSIANALLTAPAASSQLPRFEQEFEFSLTRISVWRTARSHVVGGDHGSLMGRARPAQCDLEAVSFVEAAHQGSPSQTTLASSGQMESHAEISSQLFYTLVI